MAIQDDYHKDFLIADFKESMSMLRHYDKTHWDIVRFCFSQILVIIGACWVVRTQADVSIQTFNFLGIQIQLVFLLLFLSSLFTFVCVLALCRNRVYFCKISRYINEQRHNVIVHKPFEFKNESGMWDDKLYPKNSDYKSTQIISIYFLAICSFLQMLAAVHINIRECCRIYGYIIVLMIYVLAFVLMIRKFMR